MLTSILGSKFILKKHIRFSGIEFYLRHDYIPVNHNSPSRC